MTPQTTVNSIKDITMLKNTLPAKFDTELDSSRCSNTHICITVKNSKSEKEKIFLIEYGAEISTVATKVREWNERKGSEAAIEYVNKPTIDTSPNFYPNFMMPLQELTKYANSDGKIPWSVAFEVLGLDWNEFLKVCEKDIKNRNETKTP